MNELAVREERAVERAADYRSAAVRRLGEWAESARAAHEVATQLVQTSFVPEAFRGMPGEATAAILAGSEVGLSPMASLRSFDIIQGTAAPRALTLRAIVQSFGHEVVVDESNASRCVVRGRRKSSTEWQKVTWTLDRAKSLGLTNKHNWKNQPQAMLVARATSEVCRLIAADAILGVGYTAEEVVDGATDVDFTPDEVPPVAAEGASPSGTRRMSRKAKAEPAPEPEPAESEPTEPELPMITGQQTKLLAVLMKEADLTDRDAALAYAGKVIGREISSRNELTADEASRVIDQLKADQQAMPAAADDTTDQAELPTS